MSLRSLAPTHAAAPPRTAESGLHPRPADEQHRFADSIAAAVHGLLAVLHPTTRPPSHRRSDRPGPAGDAPASGHHPETTTQPSPAAIARSVFSRSVTLLRGTPPQPARVTPQTPEDPAAPWTNRAARASTPPSVERPPPPARAHDAPTVTTNETGPTSRATSHATTTRAHDASLVRTPEAREAAHGEHAPATPPESARTHGAVQHPADTSVAITVAPSLVVAPPIVLPVASSDRAPILGAIRPSREASPDDPRERDVEPPVSVVRYAEIDPDHARVEVAHPTLGTLDVDVHRENETLDVTLLTRSVGASIALRAAEEGLRRDLRELRHYRVRTEPARAESPEGDEEP